MNSLHQFAFLAILGSGTSFLQELPCRATFTLSPCSSVLLCACVHSLWLSNTSVSGPLALFQPSTPPYYCRSPYYTHAFFKYTHAHTHTNPKSKCKHTKTHRRKHSKCSWVLFVSLFCFLFFKRVL